MAGNRHTAHDRLDRDSRRPFAVCPSEDLLASLHLDLVLQKGCPDAMTPTWMISRGSLANEALLLLVQTERSAPEAPGHGADSATTFDESFPGAARRKERMTLWTESRSQFRRRHHRG